MERLIDLGLGLYSINNSTQIYPYLVLSSFMAVFIVIYCTIFVRATLIIIITNP